MRALLLFCLLGLSGCASMSAVSTVSGSAMDGVLSLFQGEEVSLPLNTKATLASCQRGLHQVGFKVDILEQQDDGYALRFANDKLKGSLEVHAETARMNTVFVQVRSGLMRNTSVEKAILKSISDSSRHTSKRSRFSFKGYKQIYTEPSGKEKHLAWFRQGADVPHHKAIADPQWVQIQLPSMRSGYIPARDARI